MGQTVNLVAYAFAGSNPAAPTLVTGWSTVAEYLVLRA